MPILTEEMKRLVREQKLGFAATVCQDGTPNLSPKGTTAVWDDDHLVFLDLRSPQTIENLRSNPAIEINLVDQLVRKGYRFKGTASVLDGGELFDAVLARYTAEGLGEYTERVRHVVLVKVERALPIESPAYDLGATEDDLATRYSEYWNDLWSRRKESG